MELEICHYSCTSVAANELPMLHCMVTEYSQSNYVPPHTRMSFSLSAHAPTHLNRRVIREQWIRAKYERKEFTAEASEELRPYAAGEA